MNTEYTNNPDYIFPRISTILGKKVDITNLGPGKFDKATINTFNPNGTEEIINFSFIADSKQVYVSSVNAISRIEWEIYFFNDGAGDTNIEVKPLILVIPQ